MSINTHRSFVLPLFIVSVAFSLGSILLPARAYAFGPYCGDGVVNQAWEQCDGGSQCSDKCLLPNRCSDVVLARVIVTDTETTEERIPPADPYVGGSTENHRVPPGAWFALYYNGQYFTDSDISGYENVPELAVERKQGSIRLRWHNHLSSTWTTNYYEYIAGYIELYQGTISNQTNDSQAAIEPTVTAGGFRDRVSVANGHSNFAFVVGGGSGHGWWDNRVGDVRDGIYTNYVTTAASCVVPEPTCTLTASPTSIDSGDVSTLTWTTDNATSVSINSGIGSVSLDGSRTVTPSSNTTYTLTATNASGVIKTCSATVHVQQPAVPTCTISASPSRVSSGNGVTLTWGSSNAHSATIASLGSVALDGSRTVYPWESRSYTMTVHGANGQTATCSTNVEVEQQAAPTCWINTSPSSIQEGGSTTLQWGSNNANSATISDLGSVSVSGSRTVYPYGTRSYSMTVYGNNGQTATCSTDVTVQQYSVPTCSISASPNTVDRGNATTLSWNSSDGVQSAYITNIGNVNKNGSQVITVNANTTYTMTVYGRNGQSNTCTTYVNTNAPVVNNLTCTISATPSVITAGQYSYLTWTSTGPVTSATLSDSGVGNVAPNGALSVHPDTTRNYTLTVHGAQGQIATCNAFVTVGGNNPYIALTQIPYTGIDTGTMGDLMIWTLIVGLAGSVGYLILHYRGKELLSIFR